LALIFYIVGAVCALIFILSNLIRTFRRQRKVRFIELFLVFLIVALLIVSLIIDNFSDARFGLIEQLNFLVILPLFLTGLAVAVIESIRPQGLKSSRGLTSVSMAIVLLVATLTNSILSLIIEQSATPIVRRPTPVNETPTGFDPCDFGQLGARLSGDFLGIIAIESGITQEQLLARFAEDGSISAAQLVQENGGDPEDLVVVLREFVDNLLLGLVADGCIPPIARPLALTQIEPFIGSSVYSDFNTLVTGITAQLGGGGQAVESVPTSQSTPNESQLQATRIALITAIPTVDRRPTATNTLTSTPSITPSPTATRTLAPTATATPTRERFVTATPTLTATLPNPCLATANFNVNMRNLPQPEGSEVVILIPFDTVFTVYAPNEDKTWWFAQYEGEAGWINGEFISLTNPCLSLPARKP